MEATYWELNGKIKTPQTTLEVKDKKKTSNINY